MILNSPDPVGTESAIIRPGGSYFVYESETSFQNGWAASIWFKYDWPLNQEDRLMTFEDLEDSSNDLRVRITNDNGTRKIIIDTIEIVDGQLTLDQWQLLTITTLESGNLLAKLNNVGFGLLDGEPVNYPLNPRIVIGNSPLRSFRGEMWDIRIYDKRIDPLSGLVLYNDAIDNEGKLTVPL